MQRGRKAKPIEVRRGSFTAKIYPGRKTVAGRPYQVFRLSYHEPGGRRVLKDFSALARAKAAATDAASSFALARPVAIQFHPDDRRDFDAAIRILKPLGLGCYQAAVELADARKLLPPGTTLAEAVSEFARRHPANAVRISVADAAKASVVYRLKLATHLDRFSNRFQARLDSITGPRIGTWLRDLRNERGLPLGARTIANYRASVSTLFAFAKAQGWVSRDTLEEVREVPVPRAKAVAEVGVFDARQIRAILEVAPSVTTPPTSSAGCSGIESMSPGPTSPCTATDRNSGQHPMPESRGSSASTRNSLPPRPLGSGKDQPSMRRDDGSKCPMPAHASSTGFHTRSNPNPSKSFTFVVANSWTP